MLLSGTFAFVLVIFFFFFFDFVAGSLTLSVLHLSSLEYEFSERLGVLLLSSFGPVVILFRYLKQKKMVNADHDKLAVLKSLGV